MLESAANLLEVRALRKTYPGVVALGGVDFTLRAGEVHALVGENGAGKSTLARIICGITQPDAGPRNADPAAGGATMLLRGQPYAPASKHDARQRGVCMVMQELNLLPTLTIAENIYLDALPHRLGVIDYRRLHGAARAVMARVGLAELDPGRSVASLGIGQQQMVEIAASLRSRADVLILDEPTAALTYTETDLLFARMRELRAAGVGIIYISHRMEEIKRIADRITILRDGLVVATRAAGEIEIDEIVRLMVGREGVARGAFNDAPTGACAPSKLETRNPKPILRVRHLRRPPAVQEVSFDLYRGEILGFAGLMGSGRTETMRLIFGADRATGGEVYLHGAATPAVIRSPRQAVRQGIALLTEDRKGQGLFLGLPIRENATLPKLAELALGRTWVQRARQTAASRRAIDTLAIRCHGPEQTIATLSGGNQQKVVIAKWLLRDCSMLIFDEPTRGIDVGAKFEIYRLLRELAQRGKAIIVVSSDLKELLALADRVAVMSAGKLVATFARGEWTQDAIMAAALSGYGVNAGSASRGAAEEGSPRREPWEENAPRS